MTNFAERRKYQRCTITVCKALMSWDGKKWDSMDLSDISAGGLKFASKSIYDIGQRFQIELDVYNMMSEFNMRLEGSVVNIIENGGKRLYGVRFHNINKYNQVQLDEIIKSKAAVSNVIQPVHLPEDGIYAFMFIPRARPIRISSYRRF